MLGYKSSSSREIFKRRSLRHRWCRIRRLKNIKAKNLSNGYCADENKKSLSGYSYFDKCLNNITNILSNTKFSNTNYGHESDPKSCKISKCKTAASSDSTSSDITTMNSTMVQKYATNKALKLRLKSSYPEMTPISKLVEFRPKEKPIDVISPLSSIYCIDSKNCLYNITFYTSNIRMFPLYLQKREGPDLNNEKEIQSENYWTYKTKLSVTSSRFSMLRKVFYIPSNYKVKYSKMSSMTQPVKVYSSAQCGQKDKTKNTDISISATTTYPKTYGIIHLVWDNISIEVQTDLFQIDSIRQKWLHDDYINTGKIVNNYASLVTRYRSDVVEFRFEVKHMHLQGISAHKNRGSQVRDHYTYIPYISDINNRRVILALPTSQYFYIDPMNKIRQKNWENAMNKCEPDWLRETRHKRTKKENEEDFALLINKVTEQRHLSTMQVEQSGTTYKIKGGILRVKKMRPSFKYEIFIEERQRQLLEQQANKFRHLEAADNLVPDWDMEKYDF